MLFLGELLLFVSRFPNWQIVTLLIISSMSKPKARGTQAQQAGVYKLDSIQVRSPSQPLT